MLTHAPLHSVVPAGQLHCPATHVEPPVHTFPHAPQLEELVCRLMQLCTQEVSPGAHVEVQAPAEQVRLPAQALAQAPQLCESLFVSTHRPWQKASGAVQPQVPARHVVLPAQALEQAPQCEGLENRSRHAPPHDVKPGPHAAAQVPLLQTGVAPTQLVPQAPQLFGSDRRSEHDEPQGTSAALQIATASDTASLD
jgi:hypothetical protein